MWPYAFGIAVAIALIGIGKKFGSAEPYEGSAANTEEGFRAKRSMPTGFRNFYYPVGGAPTARDENGRSHFWDGEEWRAL